MKKIITLSALAVILTACSTGEEKKTKSVSELGFETSIQTKSSSEEKREEKVTETTSSVDKKKETSKSSIEKYVGKYKTSTGESLVLNSDESIEVFGQKTKVKVKEEGDIIHLDTGLGVGGLPEFYTIYPAGVAIKGEQDSIKSQDDVSKNRIIYMNKNSTILYFAEKTSETTTTVSSSSTKNSNFGISGVWVNSSAASSINQVTISEGSISVKGQTYKTEISSYEGNVKQVKVIDNAVAGGIGNFYYVPAGEKTPASLIRSHKESTTSNDRLVWVSGASGATSEFIKR